MHAGRIMYKAAIRDFQKRREAAIERLKAKEEADKAERQKLADKMMGKKEEDTQDNHSV